MTLRFAVVILVCLTAPALATPALGGPNQVVSFTSLDPNIAASQNHLVITEGSYIAIYKKDGTFISSQTVMDLFKPLWDKDVSPNLNDGLNLPPQAPCFRNWPQDNYITFPDTGSEKFWSYCLTSWYDARVLYDEQRDRFVIVALARNEAAKCATNPDAILDARRTKIVVAYSGSSDPTQGWWFTYFDGVPGESCTTTSCQNSWGYVPGDAADYPTIGLVENVLMVNVQNVGRPDNCTINEYKSKTTALHVWNANAMSSGSYTEATCGGLCSWVYAGSDFTGSTGYADGSQVVSWTAVANTHGDSYLHRGWFAQPDPGFKDILDVWHFAVGPTSTRPTLRRAFAPLPKFDKTSSSDIKYEYKQPGSSNTIELTFTKSLVMRDQMLYYADCGGMNGSGSKADMSIRMQGLIPAGSGSSVTFTTGRSATWNADGIGYGSVALEVDASRNIVMTFWKTGQSDFTGNGAHYLTWTAGDSARPNSRMLAQSEAKTSTTGKMDTAGIGLAPGGRVYMMQPYVNSSGSWKYAVNYVSP